MSKFPAYLAGQRLTAALLSSGQADVVRKATTTTRPSTATVADDPDLVTSCAINSTYFVEFFVKYSTTTAAGFKSQWTVPASFTIDARVVEGLGDNAVDNTNAAYSGRFGLHLPTTDVAYGSRNSTAVQVWCYEWAILTCNATAGNVAFRWSQRTSTVDLTGVSAGSFVRTTQLA